MYLEIAQVVVVLAISGLCGMLCIVTHKGRCQIAVNKGAERTTQGRGMLSLRAVRTLTTLLGIK